MRPVDEHALWDHFCDGEPTYVPIRKSQDRRLQRPTDDTADEIEFAA